MNKAALSLSAAILLAGVLTGSAQDKTSKQLPRSASLTQGENAGAQYDNSMIETTWMAYSSLKPVILDLVKRLNCTGKTMVLYGPGQADSLLSLKMATEQLELVRARMKLMLDSPAPALPGVDAPVPAPAAPAILSGPVRQALLDLGVLLSASGASRRDIHSDEGGLIPMVAQTAVANGCFVYWPDQAAPNLFTRPSKLILLLKEIGEMTDNGEAADKPAGLQQKLRSLQAEARRAEAMIQALDEKIGQERRHLADADKKIEQIRAEIDWIVKYTESGRDSATQDKLNKTFSKSWDDLETAVKRQMSHALPQTMEDQEKIGELSKRVDLIRSQTEWLAQYTRDEMDLALQHKLKRLVSQYFDELTAAIRNRDGLITGAAKAVNPASKEKKQWEAYAAAVKLHIELISTVLDSYTAVRKTLFNADNGASPLNELLRVESLRDLTFDENFREHPDASIVHLKLQKIAGTSRSSLGGNAQPGFSGGVIFSFVQYDPNGKVKNSGVETSYTGFRSNIN